MTLTEIDSLYAEFSRPYKLGTVPNFSNDILFKTSFVAFKMT